MEVLSDKIVKTRKPHLCFACHRTFPAGTEMRAQTAIYDGIGTSYCCPTCETLIGEFPDEFEDDNMFPSECVTETVLAYKVESPEELLETLRAGSAGERK